MTEQEFDEMVKTQNGEAPTSLTGDFKIETLREVLTELRTMRNKVATIIEAEERRHSFEVGDTRVNMFDSNLKIFHHISKDITWDQIMRGGPSELEKLQQGLGSTVSASIVPPSSYTDTNNLGLPEDQLWKPVQYVQTEYIPSFEFDDLDSIVDRLS